MKKLFIGIIALVLIAIIIIGIMYTGGIQLDRKYYFGLDRFFNVQARQPEYAPYANRGPFPGALRNRPDSRGVNNSAGNINMANAVNQSPVVLKNIESLNKATSLLNDAIKLIQMDPYVADKIKTNMQNDSKKSPENTVENKSVNQVSTPQGGTVINIYPNNTSSGSMETQSSMGKYNYHYDPVKMERLHSKLYKVAYGMELIRQLNEDLTAQTELASINLQYPAAYYQSFYNYTITNKMKMERLLTYLNEAEDLVNINPFISSDGLIFDRERMSQIHTGIFKLAEGVAQLNLLNGEFLKQSVSISNLYQTLLNNYSNEYYRDNSGFFGFADNFDMRTILNVTLLFFVMVLFAGLFGIIIKMFRKNI